MRGFLIFAYCLVGILSLLSQPPSDRPYQQVATAIVWPMAVAMDLSFDAMKRRYARADTER